MSIDPTAGNGNPISAARGAPVTRRDETQRDVDYRVRLMIEAMVRDDRTEEEIVAAVDAMIGEQRRAA